MQITPYITEKQIQKKIKQLAREIQKDFKKDIHCIVILDGAMVFFADLMRELKKLNLNITYESMKVKSYDGTNSTGKINLQLDATKVKNKDILIIEDIIDTGLTAEFIINHLKKKKPKSLKLCALLDKKERTNTNADYVGFEVPDEFLVGYGLDYNEQHRDLPFIGILKS